MSSEYNYDDDAQFFPFFFLTVTSLITLPLTYTLLRAPGSTTSASKAPKIDSPYTPRHADIIETQRSKQKRKELRLKRMLTAATGWAVILYMVYLMSVTARHVPKIWNPYDILDIGMSASEKQINSRYRKLSVTMHPDKRQPVPEKNLTSEAINDEWVEIVKAYKALTDEEVRNNFIQYGNPDGKQSTSFGIALPQFLVAEGSGKYVLVFYGMLLGIGLPWLVGKWWYGMQKLTREKVLVTSAGNMFREYKERMDGGDVVGAVSSAAEYREILSGAKADAGLGKIEKLLLSAQEADGAMLPKDKQKLQDMDDPVRRKTIALLWAYLTRIDLDDKTLEAEKYEIAPAALRMTEAFTSTSLAFGFMQPTIASYHLAQSLTQALPPNNMRLPLLQLPHFTSEIVHNIETSNPTSTSKDHLTLQTFMALPAEQRTRLATAAGLSTQNLKQAEHIARQLPLLRIETAFFKVQGEKYIIPSSLVQFVIKARFIPPGTTNVPPVSEKDLADPDPAEGDLAAQREENEQHPPPLVHAPYLPRDRSPRWHVFLGDTRQGKIAVPPFTFGNFDKKPFNEDGSPTFEVVTMKMQFQAPPQQGEFKFQMQMVCDSYVGFDEKRDVVMVVDDAAKAQDVDSDDDISEPDEDTIAGQMAALKGQSTAPTDPDHAKKVAERKARRQALREKEAESDYESGTDEDEESASETDTDTDSDDELLFSSHRIDAVSLANKLDAHEPHISAPWALYDQDDEPIRKPRTLWRNHGENRKHEQVLKIFCTKEDKVKRGPVEFSLETEVKTQNKSSSSITPYALHFVHDNTFRPSPIPAQEPVAGATSTVSDFQQQQLPMELLPGNLRKKDQYLDSIGRVVDGGEHDLPEELKVALGQGPYDPLVGDFVDGLPGLLRHFSKKLREQESVNAIPADHDERQEARGVGRGIH